MKQKLPFASFFFFVFILIAYLPVLIAHQTVDPDASIILKNLSDSDSISGYLTHLISLKTVDFQPLRDLTLSLDLWIFNHFDINTFIIQNFIWWIASLFVLRNILSLILPSLNTFTNNLILTLFGIYPLFTSVISWGMNRKHLMAFFFILMATSWILKKREELSGKNILIISLFYVASVLSQPIHILWPVWSILITRKTKTLLPLCLLPLLISLASLNWIYYHSSPVYNFFYAKKTSDLFNIADKLLAGGHYLFQLVFPYLLSFKYDLSHWSVLAGLMILVCSLLLLIKQKKHFKEILPWISLALLPIIVVLNDPQVLADSYLLLPAACLLILILKIFEMNRIEIRPAYLALPLIVWTCLSYYESSAWTSRRDLSKRSFHRRPSCASVTNYVMVSYDLFEPAPEGMKYFEENNCLNIMQVTPQTYRTMAVLFARHYFHSEEIPLEQRMERMRSLEDKHHLAHLAYVGMLIKNGMDEEARSEAKLLEDAWGRFNLTADHDEITERYVHPYCVKEQIHECLAITSLFAKKTKTPYL